MSSTPPGTAPSTVTRALARSRVGSISMIGFVGAAAAPLMVVAALTSTAWAVTGFVGIPVVFLLTGAVLALFAVGYTTMARHVANAGALYSYVVHGLGRPLGVGAAGVALLAYNGLQIGLYGAFGVISSGVAASLSGLEMPWWSWALIAWLAVALLGVLRVDLNGRVLSLLLAAECVIILLADIVMLADPAGGTISLAALSPAHLATTAIGAPLVVTATAFLGFEAPTVYAEEARDPRRNIPIATFSALGIIAGLYALSSWAMTVTLGPDRIVGAARDQGSELLFNLISGHLGTTAGGIARILLLTSVFAGLLAFHNTVARYSFALGRERVLPAVLGTTGRRTGSPKVGSLVQSGLGLLVLLCYAVAGLDPMVALFFTLGTGGGLGVLMLLATTSISVVVFFARHRTAQDSPWRTALLPGLAALLLVTGVGLAVARIDILLGVAPGSMLTWLIPLTYLAALLAGISWALVLRQRNPHAYLTIGRGAEADAALPNTANAPTEPSGRRPHPSEEITQ
ncbi:APC family permease [Haloactinomyces albus]|uniref:Amino acid transporter n=1 Tax=Haloactinomyces albus TaxID=1352928 RepID=A0AAE3ZIU6_9ACTN|nr:APC family permease [Haloactinomyces albus]MDR7303704.1 amino acid transporter [Haloactinomyces albus]